MMNISFEPSICIHRSIILIFIEKRYACRFFSTENIFSAIFDFQFGENPHFRDEFQALRRRKDQRENCCLGLLQVWINGKTPTKPPKPTKHRRYKTTKASWTDQRTGKWWWLLLFVGCLTSQQHASVSQGQICTDNFTWAFARSTKKLQNRNIQNSRSNNDRWCTDNSNDMVIHLVSTNKTSQADTIIGKKFPS